MFKEFIKNCSIFIDNLPVYAKVLITFMLSLFIVLCLVDVFKKTYIRQEPVKKWIGSIIACAVIVGLLLFFWLV